MKIGFFYFLCPCWAGHVKFYASDFCCTAMPSGPINTHRSKSSPPLRGGTFLCDFTGNAGGAHIGRLSVILITAHVLRTLVVAAKSRLSRLALGLAPNAGVRTSVKSGTLPHKQYQPKIRKNKKARLTAPNLAERSIFLSTPRHFKFLHTSTSSYNLQKLISIFIIKLIMILFYFCISSSRSSRLYQDMYTFCYYTIFTII